MKDRYAGENKVDETLELAEGIEKELHTIGLGAAVKMVCEELTIDRCAELLGDEPSDRVTCIRCGIPITDAQHDDQGGLCDDCAVKASVKKADHPGECSSPHSYCKTCDMEVCDAAEAEFHRHQGCDVTELPTDMNVNSNPDRSSPVYQERTPPVDAYIHQSRRINLASLKYGKAIARRVKKGDLPHYAYDILESPWKLETDDQGNQVLVKG
jgi:hypothetical protein